MKGPLVSVVVPVYQNAGSLRDLFARLDSAAAARPGETFEFVFVDDASTDGSRDILRQMARSDARVRVVLLSRNFGSWSAILAGLAEARGAAAVMIAADLQDPPELIPEMVDRWRAGRKVVLAARRSRADPLLTRVFADLFYRAFRRVALPAMPRHGFDFFLLDRQVVGELLAAGESNTNLPALIVWLGHDPVVLPYDRQAREGRYGPSAWSLARRVTYFVDSFVAFSSLPLRAASTVGVVMAALGAAYAVVLAYLRVARGAPVDGWTSLMVALLVVSGVQMVMIGVLGEYLWRTLEESRRRPRFVVDEVISAATPSSIGKLEEPQA